MHEQYNGRNPKHIQRPASPKDRRRIPAQGNSRDEKARRRNPPPSGRTGTSENRANSGRTVNSGRAAAGRTQASPAANKSAVKVRPGRNVMLAAILMGLVTVFLIILGVQSCSGKGASAYSSKDKNSVLLATETSAEGGDKTGLPVFAEYTDESKNLEIDSEYGILIDLSDNKVIASKNGEEKIYPASMTKIMTLIVAYENVKSLDDTFTFTSDILDPLYAENASQAGFAAGETVTVRDMLYGCILPSGADATVGLATCIAGSEKDFAALMNSKAEELGLKNTHFVTVSGLHDDDHYSTCHEMAIILEYAISDPYLREVLSTYKYTTAPTPEHPDGIELTSTLFSRMSGDEADGIFIQGGKTGYTNEALNCLATFAARCTEDMAPYVKPEYLLVTAHASGEYTPVYDAINVYKSYCEK